MLRELKENSTELIELRKVIKRLDVLISIMLATSASDLTVTKKIQILNAAGLRSVEIADILGITASNVSVQLSKQRKKKKKNAIKK